MNYGQCLRSIHPIRSSENIDPQYTRFRQRILLLKDISKVAKGLGTLARISRMDEWHELKKKEKRD
jgi:hypothetical protein